MLNGGYPCSRLHVINSDGNKILQMFGVVLGGACPKF